MPSLLSEDHREGDGPHKRISYGNDIGAAEGVKRIVHQDCLKDRQKAVEAVKTERHSVFKE
jgi:hypothetical protein